MRLRVACVRAYVRACVRARERARVHARVCLEGRCDGNRETRGSRAARVRVDTGRATSMKPCEERRTKMQEEWEASSVNGTSQGG
eukprot:4172555-Pleurochrysis_carterae.AAC.1